MENKQVIREVYAAIENGDNEKALELLGQDKSRLRLMTPFGSWLHVAATAGNLELVRRLVALGADVNQRGGIFNGAPINLAASEGHLDVVSYLLSAGAELDVSEPERNPLFTAIYGGHPEIVKLLISKGVDTKVKYIGESMKNMDALAFALERGQTEIAKILQSSQI